MYLFKYDYPNGYGILRVLKFGRSRVQIVCWGSEIAEEFEYPCVIMCHQIRFEGSELS